MRAVRERRAVERGDRLENGRHRVGSDDHAGAFGLRNADAGERGDCGRVHAGGYHDGVALDGLAAGGLDADHPTIHARQRGDGRIRHHRPAHLGDALGAGLGGGCRVDVSVVVADGGGGHAARTQARLQTRHLALVRHARRVSPGLQARHFRPKRAGVGVGGCPCQMPAPSQADVGVEQAREPVPSVQRAAVERVVAARLFAEGVYPSERVAGRAHARLALVDERDVRPAPREMERYRPADNARADYSDFHKQSLPLSAPDCAIMPPKSLRETA